jgi:glycine oxidase
VPATHPQFDVAVLGGGTIGLAVAWRARARGLSVCLLERGALGGGATHVAAGMLAPVAEADPGERELLALGLDSARRWPAFAAELEEASGVPVGYRARGTLVVARDRDAAEALDRERGLRERLGVPVERLLPSAARRLEPALAPALRGAFLAPDDHAVDPRRLAAALAQAAARAGAVLRPGVTVLGLGDRGEVLTDQGPVLAGQVVLATGAAAGAALPGLDGLRVRPVKGQTVRLRGEPLLERTVRYDGGYLVPRADGEIVLGATVEERGDVAVTAGGIYELLRDAAEVVPGILELEVTEVLAGLRPGTPDNAPVLGRHGGVLVAGGHFRNGILLTPVTAELVAGALAGDGPDLPAAFSPGRFDLVAA